MRSRRPLFAGAAAGVFALGAAAGWMAPTALKSAHAADVATSAPAAADAPQPIALGTAPNYRAIVAQNRDSVVGITIEGEMKVSSDQQFNPFGDGGDDNPFFQFFRQMPRPHSSTHARARARASSSAPTD